MEKPEEESSSRKRISPSIDRLSALPDVIICHILSFLPTKCSVATSVLARRWRFLWAHVPDLDFGDGAFGRRRPSIDTIHRVVSQYRVENMNTFRLHCKSSKDSRLQIEACIASAVERNVKALDFFPLTIIPLPASILTCKTLVDLTLGGVGYLPMTGDVCMPALKRLCLNSVWHESDESLPHLLSGCPVLEELIVDRMDADVDWLYISSRTLERLSLESTFFDKNLTDDGYTVEIHAPALIYLKLRDSVSKDVLVGPLTSLIEADVDFEKIELMDNEDEEDDVDVSDNDVAIEGDGGDVPHNGGLVEGGADDALNVLFARSVFEFVGNLCNVKNLKLSTGWLEVADAEFCTWTVKFHNLTKLELGGDWRFITNFLENAENLEVLKISTDDEDLKFWNEPKQVPACLLSYLRIVSIYAFGFADEEFSMIRYILRNAIILKRMEIHSKRYGTDLEKKHEALKIISLFKRGSVECELAFN